MNLENKPNYLRYSGASVTITLNPLHWRLIPWARKHTSNEWPDSNIWEASASWLFLTVRLWIDDGCW